jgi:FAD/FMN-containing dehydrogenase
VAPGRPNCVVYAHNTSEVQKLVKYANEHSIPVIPRSSGVSFYGAGIPGEGGIVIDLSRMNRILEIDEKDRKVRVEPGVTWLQLQQELEKHGMMVCNPLLPHPQKSVLTSMMERESGLITKYEYNEVFLTAEMVMPTGDLFWTGTAIGKGHVGKVNPEGVIPSTRLFLGSQGTLGIATWANLKAVYLPTMSKLFFIPLKRAEDIVGPAYKILRIRLGNEFLVLNNLNLASMLAKDAAELNVLKENLPAYTAILCLSGLQRYPEEKIAYEEEALVEIANQEHFELCNTVAAIPDLGETFAKLLRRPWTGQTWWKYLYKGQRQDVFFNTTLDRVPEFTEVMFKLAAKHRYPATDISIYVQPKEHGRVCLCEYGFTYNPDNAAESSGVRRLFLEASQTAIDMGGLFSSPYGAWADMVYSRATSTATALRTVKGVLDPKNIMNPGKLCF